MSVGGIVLGPEAGLRVGDGGILMPGLAGSALALTLSGNEVTDAVRAAGLAGDGLSPEGSMGVWEATTNLVTNGGFETNTTGWSSTGLNSFARDTSIAKFGSASAKGVGDADGDRCACDVSCTSGSVYTYSAWVYLESLSATGLFLRVADNGGAGPNVFTSSVTAVTGSWVRLSVTFTAASTSTHQMQVRQSGAGGVTFYVDGVQVEQQPLATPYVETNGSTASRSASSVTIPASVLDETQAWIAVRFRRNWGTSNEPGGGSGFPYVLRWNDDSNNKLEIYYVESTNNLQFDRRSSAGMPAVGGNMGTSGFAAGVETVSIIAAWTAAGRYLSRNGAAFVSKEGSPEYVPALSASPTLLSNSSPDADVFWLACGTGTLTNTDAANIHAWGNSDPSPGLFPTAADLTMIWRGIDSTARTY